MPLIERRKSQFTDQEWVALDLFVKNYQYIFDPILDPENQPNLDEGLLKVDKIQSLPEMIADKKQYKHIYGHWPVKDIRLQMQAYEVGIAFILFVGIRPNNQDDPEENQIGFIFERMYDDRVNMMAVDFDCRF